MLLALSIGAIGGVIADYFDLPLAWMIGPMGATILASLSRLPVQVPMGLRTVFLGVLGSFLGSSFSIETMEKAREWPLTLGAVLVFVALVTACTAVYYKKVAGLDGVSALFSATPGGLTPMVVIGSNAGGVEQHIALTQGLRVVLVVFLTPALIFGLLGYEHSQSEKLTEYLFSYQDGFGLALSVLAGIFIAKKIKLPAPQLTGAMFSSAFVHMMGWVSHGLPEGLLAVTLWILGSAIGSRFSGLALGTLLRLSLHGVGAVLVLLGVTTVFSYGLSSLLDLEFLPILLAFAPGGVAEMCLIALALDVDPAFVAFHHLVRISMILLLAPVVGRMLKKNS